MRPNSAADPGLVLTPASTTGSGSSAPSSPRARRPLCEPGADPGRERLQRGLDRDRRPGRVADGQADGQERALRVRRVHACPIPGLVGFHRHAPANFTIGAGATQQLNFTFTRTTAALNAYTGGQITLTGDDDHVVRIPVVIRPVAIAAPLEVSGNGGRDQLQRDVRLLRPVRGNCPRARSGDRHGGHRRWMTRRTARARSRHRMRSSTRLRSRRASRSFGSSCSTPTSHLARTSTCACSRAQRWLGRALQGRLLKLSPSTPALGCSAR